MNSKSWCIKVVTGDKINTLTVIFAEAMTAEQVWANAGSKFGIERIIAVWPRDDLPK